MRSQGVVRTAGEELSGSGMVLSDIRDSAENEFARRTVVQYARGFAGSLRFESDRFHHR